MSKKQRKPPSKPSKAYLISFGDTMTAMLAFFIVLNTLAEEQTGANLHSGTGSFVRALQSMGVPGWYAGEGSSRVHQMAESNPIYEVNDGEPSDDDSGAGPDEDDNRLRLLDREEEQMQRRLVELEQQFSVELTEESSSEVSFDLFERLGSAPEVLPKAANKVLAQSLPLLAKSNYRVEIDVWSTTPSPSAIERSAHQAAAIQAEVATRFRLSGDRLQRISAAARIWPYSKQKRPTLTINVIKSTSAASTSSGR